MKKRNGKQATDVGQDDILPEYDFSRGKRNKYAKRYPKEQTSFSSIPT